MPGQNITFEPTNSLGPFNTPTEYRIQQGTKTAMVTKRDDSRWYITYEGNEKRLGKKCTFTSAHRALRTMGF